MVAIIHFPLFTMLTSHPALHSKQASLFILLLLFRNFFLCVLSLLCALCVAKHYLTTTTLPRTTHGPFGSCEADELKGMSR